MKNILFIDLEVNPDAGKILDVGACSTDGQTFHHKQVRKLVPFLQSVRFIAGHNFIKHDLSYLRRSLPDIDWSGLQVIDTLSLAPLLFPKRPYHKLAKDDKLEVEERSNPLHDALKSKELWENELFAFQQLDHSLQQIWYSLLKDTVEFKGFFRWLGYEHSTKDLVALIRPYFDEKICTNAPLRQMAESHPVALAYALALISVDDSESLTPGWVILQYPEADRFSSLLRGIPCAKACKYCDAKLDIYKGLKHFFGFDAYRKFGGKKMQEEAVAAAVKGESLLTIFPTGGGKSITFQVPALMAGEATRGLTVVISPLQSLMKDQVDNLEQQGIISSATINGLLDPIERAKSIEKVMDGTANLLYISPESLRSKTIEHLLLKRKIARFVIDEAHCFSSWGQDFRVDYLYIGDFIQKLQKDKRLQEPIPVSCFTATAKQKVIDDIITYFNTKLGLKLRLFNAGTARTNLHFQVLERKDDADKYRTLRDLLEAHRCPTIIYVSRTMRAEEIALRLIKDGFNASFYHGKRTSADKVENQEKFIKGEFEIMVATSAFGMGVDKKDVGMVIHYDISDSLENYVQEAGRAGRDEGIEARCYVLYNTDDLNKHFILHIQSKLQISEIKDIWKAIKEATKFRKTVSQSALEIARAAGWDETLRDAETRVKTAIAALEEAGYVKRLNNSPRIYASSILSKSAQEAIDKISHSRVFTKDQKEKAIRIIKRLFSSKHRIKTEEEEAEYRIDYLSDVLGIVKEHVIEIIHLMKEEKILADTKDLNVFIKQNDTTNKTKAITASFTRIEELLCDMLSKPVNHLNVKDVNEAAERENIKEFDTGKLIRLLNYWSVKKWISVRRDSNNKNYLDITLKESIEVIREHLSKHQKISAFIIEYLFEKSREEKPQLNFVSENLMVSFSVHELRDQYQSSLFGTSINIGEIEEVLFFLSRIGAIDIEGGFMVIHNRLTIERLEDNRKTQYKEEDYKHLKNFYEQKVEQIHIVGEYARLMVQSYENALRFVDDYFKLDYQHFLQKYFKGKRRKEITKTLTPEKFDQIFGDLSLMQMEIVNDHQHQHIVVAAGPGSGKTRVLVHKLASLILLEEVKQEELLMLTFSRSAAAEFRDRLVGLLKNAVNFLHIKTFHSFCFDFVGRPGDLDKSDGIIEEAVEKIKSDGFEKSRLSIKILVIDEAQDISHREQQLIEALMGYRPEMRVIAVGDDDQNIYQFRGANNQFLKNLLEKHGAFKYELTTNYRSRQNLVNFCEAFVRGIPNRLKNQSNMAADSTSLGELKVIEHRSSALFIPLVNDILDMQLQGKTCVLCPTNSEAATIAALLQMEGKKVRLIQNNDGFRLHNLQELRFFGNQFQKDATEIPAEKWKQAVAKLKTEFKDSDLLGNCLEIIRQFENTYEKKKRSSDWKDFVFECSLDDFIDIQQDTIYVSTYHKAKGREFDNVFILSRYAGHATDVEEKHKLYVAITRAKSLLHIHIQGAGLSDMPLNLLEHMVDEELHPDPEWLSLQADLDDVWLDYFKNKKWLLRPLYAGIKLSADDSGCLNEAGEYVLLFSKKFKEELQKMTSSGYHISHAEVSFIVFWKKQDEAEEYLTVLPRLMLQKQDS
jgi:ATP-dependent DNA helicase RecQ